MLYSSEYKALFNTGKRKKYMIFVYYIIKQNEGTYQDVYHNNFRGGGSSQFVLSVQDNYLCVNNF